MTHEQHVARCLSSAEWAERHADDQRTAEALAWAKEFGHPPEYLEEIAEHWLTHAKKMREKAAQLKENYRNNETRKS